MLADGFTIQRLRQKVEIPLKIASSWNRDAPSHIPSTPRSRRRAFTCPVHHTPFPSHSGSDGGSFNLPDS